MKVLLIIVITIAVLAALAAYLFFSVRGTYRAAKRGLATVTQAGQQLSEPFSSYDALPADPPLASPFEAERRARAVADLRRVAATRTANRAARLDRSQARWAMPETDPTFEQRFDLPLAKARWEEQKAS